MADLEKKYEACVVSGVEGASLYLNNYRIAGPKPWGGGQTAYEWSRVTMDDLVQAVPELRALRESHDVLRDCLDIAITHVHMSHAAQLGTFEDCPSINCRNSRAALAKAEALQ